MMMKMLTKYDEDGPEGRVGKAIPTGEHLPNCPALGEDDFLWVVICICICLCVCVIVFVFDHEDVCLFA